MAENALRFIHKNGRVIPIRAAAQGARNAVSALNLTKRGHQVAKATSHGLKKSTPKGKPPIQVNRALDLGSLGLSVASGVIGAATFSSGVKGFLAGAAATHAIDAAGIASNVASVSGKGKLKQRTEQAAKQEARNFAIGNAIFYAGVLGVKKNREALVGQIAAIPKYTAKLLSFARKGLGVAKVVA